jgi:hypothetical protein
LETLFIGRSASKTNGVRRIGPLNTNIAHAGNKANPIDGSSLGSKTERS